MQKPFISLLLWSPLWFCLFPKTLSEATKSSQSTMDNWSLAYGQRAALFFSLYFSSPGFAMSMPPDSWKPPIVTLQTSLGDVQCELYWNHTPKTCRNFAELSRRGYYDNIKFHRVISDFMLQTGDPTGTGRGGSSIYGPLFEDEFHRELKHTGAGVLSMANSGPNTNGSQFFITLAPTQWLDGKHTVFGRIYKGIEIVKKISSMPTDNHDRPTQDIYIIKAIPMDD